MFKNLSPSAIGVTGHQSEIIELALTFGFHSMDLDSVDFATRASLRGMPYARRLIDSAKGRMESFRMGTFELPMQWEVSDEVFNSELEKLPEYAQAAAEVGCTRCVATVPPAGDELPYHENFEFHRGRFSAICAALQPAGVTFGAGFQGAEYLRKDRAFQFIHDLDAMTLLLKMIDAPNMGLVLDVWDLVVSGGSIDSIRNLPLQQIVAVQLADFPADVAMPELDQNSRLLPGSENGQVDMAGALTILAEMGYDGPVTLKPSRRVFESRKRDVVVRQTGEALTKVWRAAGLTPEGTIAEPAADAPA